MYAPSQLGNYPICGNSFTPYLENFEIPLAPGTHVIQAGAYSSRGSGTVILQVSCRPTDFPQEVFEQNSRCVGSRSRVTQSPTPEPTMPMPTTVSPTDSPTPCPGGTAGPSCQYTDAVDCNAAGSVNFDGSCECYGGSVGDRCYTRAVLCNGNGRAVADGTCMCDAGHGGLRCEHSDAVTCRGQGTVRDDGTCDCQSGGGYLTGPQCGIHTCGTDLNCYESASTVGAGGPMGWLRDLSTTPKENEPHLAITSAGFEFFLTVTLRGIGGSLPSSDAEAPRFSDYDDTATNIWITDGAGAVLCHTSFDRSGPFERTLSCTVSRTGTLITLQAHAYFFSTGLYSGAVVDPESQAYAAQRESSTSPYGLGDTYFRWSLPSVMQTFWSWRSGNCGVMVLDRYGQQQNLVLVIQDWLTFYGSSWTNDQVGQGIAGAATALLSRGCEFNARAVAIGPVDSTMCGFDDTIEVVVAILRELHPNMDDATMSMLRSVFADTVRQGLACFDPDTPGQVDNQCYVNALALFSDSLYSTSVLSDINLGQITAQCYVSVVWILHYLPTAVSDAMRPMSENQPHCTVEGSTVRCVVLGPGGSVSPLRPQTPPTDYVEAIWVKDQRGTIVHYADLSSSSTPTTQFQLPSSATSLVVFQFCNLYGLWRGVDPLASHTATLSRFTPGLWSPTGMPVPNGLYGSGGFPRQYEPAMFFSRHGRLTVILRGVGGSLVTSPGMAQLVIRVWIVDQNGQIICESSKPDEMDCSIPTGGPVRYTSTQVFVHYSTYGCWSGPVYNVANELYVSARETMAISPISSEPCTSSDNGAVDTYSDPCSWYGENAANTMHCGDYDDADFTAITMCCECHAVHTVAQTYSSYSLAYTYISEKLDFYERGLCGVMVLDPSIGSHRTVMQVLNYWLEQHNTDWVAGGGCLCGGAMTVVQIGRGLASMVRSALSSGVTYTGRLTLTVAVRFCMAFFDAVSYGETNEDMVTTLRAAFEASLEPALVCAADDMDCIERARVLYDNAFGSNTEWRNAYHAYFNICLVMLRHIAVIMEDVGPTMRYHQAFGSVTNRLVYYESGYCDALVSDYALGESKNIMLVLRHWAERQGCGSTAASALVANRNAEWTGRGYCIQAGVTDMTDVEIGKGLAAVVRSALSCGCTYTGELSLTVAVRFCLAFVRGSIRTSGVTVGDLWANLELAFERFIGPAMLCGVSDVACLQNAFMTFETAMRSSTSTAWFSRTEHYPFLCLKVLHEITAIMTDATATWVEHQPYLWVGGNFDTARIGALGVRGSRTTLFQQSLGEDYVESMWVRDQHDRVVFFSDMSATSGTAESTFSIATGDVSMATSLVPYTQYSNVRGLWRGMDCFSLEFIRATHVTGLLDASGGFVSNGQYEPGPTAHKWTPYVLIGSDRSIGVIVRGTSGSVREAPATSGDAVYVTHIWVLDQDNVAICEAAFDAPKDDASLPWLPECRLPASTRTVRTFVYTRGKGLWSGPAMRVDLEVKAARYTESTSATGVGSTLFSETNLTAPAEFDPYIMFDLQTHGGYCAILGAGGSMEPHADSRVDAIWGRDQHGVIVYFADDETTVGVTGTVSQNVTIDLRSSTTPITSIVPFVFGIGRGLRKGVDRLGFAYRQHVAVLGQSVPSPNGQYEVGSAPQEFQPYMSISSTRGAGVVVRGAGGATNSTASIAQSVTNIWITDQTGSVVCDMAFVLKGDRRSRRTHDDYCQYVEVEGGPCKDPVAEIPIKDDTPPVCVLPASATTVRSHQFSVTHGLWSGPVLTVSREVSAAVYDEMCSTIGAGPTLFSEADPAKAALYDPYAEFLTPSARGWCAVLGDSGSRTTLATGIEAIWARDQHGSVAFFDDSTTATTKSNATFDVQSAVPPVASFVPYAYSSANGLRKGFDTMAEKDPAYFDGAEKSSGSDDESCFTVPLISEEYCADETLIIVCLIALVLIVVCCCCLCCGCCKKKDKKDRPPKNDPVTLEFDNPIYDEVPDETADGGEDGGYLAVVGKDDPDDVVIGKDEGEDEEEPTGFD